MTLRDCDIAAVRRLLYLNLAEIEQLTGVPADAIREIEERIAIEQEASGEVIDVVRRDANGVRIYEPTKGSAK
jgi:uncharacterized protein YlzI (FlbEa/FlbD family)